MSERTKQKPMPSMLKSIQRSAAVASAAVDNFAASSTSTSTGVGQRERQSLLGNDALADQSSNVGGGGGGGGLQGPSPTNNPATKPPKAPPGLKMSGRHQKMQAVMDNISRHLKMQTRGSNFGFRGRDRHDATGKRYRVEVPKNMLAYVACVFFVLPLLLGLYILLRQILHGDEVHSRYVGGHHDFHKGAGHKGGGGGNLTLPGHELVEGVSEKTAEKEIAAPPQESEKGATAEGAEGDQKESSAGADTNDNIGDAKKSGEKDAEQGLDEHAEKKGGNGEDDKEADANEKGAGDAKSDGMTNEEAKEEGAKTYDEEVREEIAEDAKNQDTDNEDAEKKGEKGDVGGTEDTGDAKSTAKDESQKTTGEDAEKKENTARRRRLQGSNPWR